MSPQTLALFLGVTMAMLLAPGPSALFAFSRSLEQGPRAGFCAVAGLETGLLVHVLAAAGGISGLVASSSWALPALKFSGAGYLAWLGLREVLHAGRSSSAGGEPAVSRSYRHLFRDGLVIDLANPKTLLFFLTFLPQFVDPERGPVAAQALLLGVMVVSLAVVCDGAYVLAAHATRRRQAVPGLSRGIQLASGTAFLGLAVVAGLG